MRTASFWSITSNSVQASCAPRAPSGMSPRRPTATQSPVLRSSASRLRTRKPLIGIATSISTGSRATQPIRCCELRLDQRAVEAIEPAPLRLPSRRSAALPIRSRDCSLVQLWIGSPFARDRCSKMDQNGRGSSWKGLIIAPHSRLSLALRPAQCRIHFAATLEDSDCLRDL